MKGTLFLIQGGPGFPGIEFETHVPKLSEMLNDEVFAFSFSFFENSFLEV